MRKGLLLFSMACLVTVAGKSQLVIDNATFFIGSGATVTVQGNVTSNVDIQGTGLLQLKGSTLQNVDMGGFTIPNLELDNAAHATLLNTNLRIGSSLTLTNGRLRLGNQNLSIASGITSVTGVSSSRFIETNGTGVLTKEGLNTTAFVYPVGFSGTEFNPLTIANTGTADNISVRCLQNVLDNGLTGSPVAADFANNSWVVTEAVAGGSNLALTGEWASGDELPGFNRVKSGIARYNTGIDWDLPASNVLAASGSGPYNRNRGSIVTPGVFAVADLEKVNAARLNLKVFLQGNYNATTGLMGDALRTTNVIPTTQPYSSAINARFTRVGVYDGTASVNETVPNTTVFDVTGTNDDIVDWVYVSLLDGTTPATKLQTRAALLQRDGDVVEYNAVSGTYVPLSMPIDGDGNYHILIGHRNHLSIRTPLAQSLQDNVDFAYNFSSAQAQAYQNGSIPTNDAMASITGTFPAFALWGGNVNANNNVRYTGPSPDNLALLTLLGGNTTAVLNTIYSLGDLNLNGVVRYTGPSPDNLALLNVLSGNTTAVRTEHQ
ncbi:MAG TPA: hypothetical protein PKZ90_07655 [Chitinophagaceae bacterium]|nr:hypothetical protein [Chitinophagaceae bacterium]